MAAGIRQLSRDRAKLSAVFADLRASKAQRLKEGGLDASTERDFRGRTQTLETYLGHLSADEAKPEDIETALKKLATDNSLSQRSILNYRNALAEVFRHAKAKGYCDSSPMERFTREAYKSLGGAKAERDLDAINILTIDESVGDSYKKALGSAPNILARPRLRASDAADREAGLGLSSDDGITVWVNGQLADEQ